MPPRRPTHPWERCAVVHPGSRLTAADVYERQMGGPRQGCLAPVVCCSPHGSRVAANRRSGL
eukprot:4773589-Pyramimonas_sp.AAC.1